ncbi:MAG: EAL domain-containing protein [Pseudomonadota bacterium]
MAGGERRGGFAPRGGESPLAFAVAQRDRDTLSMVRDAIARHQVILAYQPVFPTVQPTVPAFWEGLIRILDRNGRVIPARQFVHAIEETELGRQIDCFALKLGLSTLAHHRDLRLSINMSARSIGYPRWLDTLERGLHADPTIAERLILEITESSAMMVPDILQVFMADMQNRGICFAIDDFGAGFTALRYLREFFFDIMKIDGQFISNIHANADNQVLTQAMISIGRHFEMFTIAEFVETRADAAFLAEIGIDCMQGFYFGPPSIRPSWLAPASGEQAG